MEEVILLPAARDKLENLAGILFNQNYFAIEKNALNYVDAIYDFIYSIPQRQRYATNNHRYGAWFCRYKPNRHTTWYITFDTDDKKWLVRNLFNNHTSGYATFLRNLK